MAPPPFSHRRPRQCVVELPPSLRNEEPVRRSPSPAGADRTLLDAALNNEHVEQMEAGVTVATPFHLRDEARLIGMTLHSDQISAGTAQVSAVASYNLALRYMDEDDLDSAASCFESVLDSSSPDRSPRDAAAADFEIMALSNAGYCHYLDESYSDAAICFEGSVDLCRNALDFLRAASPDGTTGESAKALMIRMVQSMTNLARAYDLAGRYRDAAVLVGEAVSLLDTIADVFDDVRDPEELDLEEDLEDSLRYVDATVKRHRGEHDRAVRAYKKYLFLYNEHQKRRGPRGASSSSSFSSSSSSRGGAISRAVRTSAAMHGVAHSLLQKSKSDEARRVALMALTIRQKAFSSSSSSSRCWPNHRDLADSAYLLGHLHRDAHEYVDALALYRRCVRIRCALLGPDHKDTLKAMCYVAIVNRERNDLTEALYVTRAILARGRGVVPGRFRREMTALRDELVREIEDVGGSSRRRPRPTGGDDSGDGAAFTPFGQRPKGRVLYGWVSGHDLHAATA